MPTEGDTAKVPPGVVNVLPWLSGISNYGLADFIFNPVLIAL